MPFDNDHQNNDKKLKQWRDFMPQGYDDMSKEDSKRRRLLFNLENIYVGEKQSK